MKRPRGETATEFTRLVRPAKYEVVRQLNTEIQPLSPYLLQLNSTSVYHWPDAPEGAVVLEKGDLVASIEGGAFVIGEFLDDAGDGWVMVVNRDRDRAAWTTVRLRTPHALVEEVARSDGHLRSVARDQGVDAVQGYADGSIVRFWLAPADSRLMRVRQPA